MTLWKRLRIGLTVLVTVTFVLPAFTCSGYRTPTDEFVTAIPAGADSSQYTPATVTHRPSDELDLSELGDWVLVFAYAWPIVLLGLGFALPKFDTHWLRAAAPLVLAPASAYFIYAWIQMGDRIAYGAVLSFIALGGLFMTAIGELLARARVTAARSTG